MPTPVDQGPLVCVRVVGSAVVDIDQQLARRAAGFGVRAEQYAVMVERAYRRAVGVGGFDQGEYRRWQRPSDADAHWTSRALSWVRALIAGPWCLSQEVGELACVLLGSLMADCDALIAVEVRLIRLAHCQDRLVALATTDMPLGTGRERVRLVGVTADYEPAAGLAAQGGGVAMTTSPLQARPSAHRAEKDRAATREGEPC